MNHTIKATDGTTIEVKDYSYLMAIKAHCSECIQWEGDPKKDCTSPLCALYPFRGKNLVASHNMAAANLLAAQRMSGNKMEQVRKAANGSEDKESP